MISIAEAKKIISSQQYHRETEEVRLEELKAGNVLAEDIISPVDLPLFSNSMMDGYVVSSDATSHEVIGEIQAGDVKDYELPDGKAYRIFTGARIPDNSLAVIMQESASREGNQVSFTEDITAGKNIRKTGDEVTKGAKVLSAGTTITPGLTGFLAKMGLTHCKVFRKPRIALLTTGDECKPVGSTLQPGEIYESNSLMLQQALADYGYEVLIRHTMDTYEATRSNLSDLLEQADVLFVTGGISVGDYDFVGRCLKDLGVTELFYKVSQKPGKPLFFGRKDNTSVLGLPGNPASSLTCFYQYGLPICRNMSGYRPEEFFLPPVQMKLTIDYTKFGPRPEFVRSEYQHDGTVIPLGKQRSSMLHSYATANCLLYIPEGKQVLTAGQWVTGYLI